MSISVDKSASLQGFCRQRYRSRQTINAIGCDTMLGRETGKTAVERTIQSANDASCGLSRPKKESGGHFDDPTNMM